MRHDKAAKLLDLARRLASSAEGLTLDEMAGAVDVGRRTAERMRDAIWDLFPQMEELPDGASSLRNSRETAADLAQRIRQR